MKKVSMENRLVDQWSVLGERLASWDACNSREISGRENSGALFGTSKERKHSPANKLSVPVQGERTSISALCNTKGTSSAGIFLVSGTGPAKEHNVVYLYDLSNNSRTGQRGIERVQGKNQINNMQQSNVL